MTPELDRRMFVKTCGLATGVAATGAGASRLDLAPVQEAEAIDPYTLAYGSSLLAGWVARDVVGDWFGAETVNEGLSDDLQEERVRELLVRRVSQNRSTIVDNKNILQGAKHVAYSDGKLAAIDALNNGKSQSEVETAATTAADSHYATVEKNLLSSFNETALEIGNFESILTSADYGGSWTTERIDFDSGSLSTGSGSTWSVIDHSHTLLNGDSFTAKAVKYEDSGSADTEEWYGAGLITNNMPWDIGFAIVDGNGDVVEDYLAYVSDWEEIYNQLTSDHTSVTDGLILWVDTIYGDVQSGDIDTSDLKSGSEWAQTISEEEDTPLAVGDLIAANFAVDPKEPVKIKFDQGAELTFSGFLATTSQSLSVQPGQTIDPSTSSDSFYFSYDVADTGGKWHDYNTGVDGGVVTFTSQPFAGVTYNIHTTAGETATAVPADFTEGDDGSGNTVWTVDISGQIDTAITEVDSVTLTSDDSGPNRRSVTLTEPFEVLEVGGSTDSNSEVTFERGQVHDDSNYITAEEFEAEQQRREELYNELLSALNDDGGSSAGGGGSSGSGFLSGEWMGVPKAGWALGGLGGSLLGYELFSSDDDRDRRGGGRY